MMTAVAYAQFPPMPEEVPPARHIFGQDTVSMFIIGDVMMHARQLEYPMDSFLEGISERMKSADITIANMEFALAGKPYSGYPAFSAPDEYAHYVKDCGTNVFLTANNHILDKGIRGLERTDSVYRAMEKDGLIQFTGTSRDSADNALRYPLVIHAKGFRIALVNFTYGTNLKWKGGWPKVNIIDRQDIGAALTKAKNRGADFVIALPHWGVEYELRHSREQEDLANWLVENGADAVIGAHPHVVQDSTVIGGAPVFYSLGNAVSNMSAPNTQIELAVKLTFTRDWNGDMKMLEPEVTYLWCSLPGRLKDSYATIAVRDYIGKRHLWKEPSDYDKMISTYLHVKRVTGIKDEIKGESQGSK